MPATNPQHQSKPAEPTDEALIASIRRGDLSSWTPLLTRYQDKLYALCIRTLGDRELALDLAQDAVLKIIQGLGSYDGRAQFSTWIYRITMNVCLSKLRSEKIRRHASLDETVRGMEGPEPTSIVDQIEQPRELSAPRRVEEGEDRRRVLAALERLEPQQRAILLLRDSRGLDYEQISEVLGVAVGTVKSRLFRARSALRELVEQPVSPSPTTRPRT